MNEAPPESLLRDRIDQIGTSHVHVGKIESNRSEADVEDLDERATGS